MIKNRVDCAYDLKFGQFLHVLYLGGFIERLFTFGKKINAKTIGFARIF